MYSVKLKVRFYETDMMGIAHHSNHFRWFELARVEYLRHLGVNLWDMMDEDIVFPIAHVHCDYKEPAKYDDTIRIDTYLIKMTRAQMVFSYKMYRDSDNTLLATGETKNAFTSKTTNKVVRLEDKYFLPLKGAQEIME